MEGGRKEGNIPIDDDIGAGSVRCSVTRKVQVRALQLVGQTLAPASGQPRIFDNKSGEGGGGTDRSGIFSFQISFVSWGTKSEISVAI